jgi:hypothetical protein
MFIVRWILAASLLLGVFTETGLWTTTALTLVFVQSEIEVYLENGRKFIWWI